MQHKPYFIGIAGGSGSGKTSLIRALKAVMPEGSICVVSQDDYYHPIERQVTDANGKVNFDLPDALDLDAMARDLASLANGEAIHRKEYTFNNHAKAAEWFELKPAPVIIAEGLFLLEHAPTREHFDLKVFVDASEETQLQRRLLRDAAERGYGPDEVHYQWEHHVLPAYRQYLLPHRHLCDLHVVNEYTYDKAVAVLRDHLLRTVGVTQEVFQSL